MEFLSLCCVTTVPRISFPFISNHIVPRILWCVSRCAVYWCLRVFHPEWEIVGEIKRFKLGAAEAVDQRVQEAVYVGEDHEAIKGHSCFILDGFRCFLDPGDQQNHPGYGTGEEAQGEDHHDGGHQHHGPLQLGGVSNRFLPEPVDDAHCAVHQDDEGNDNLGEEDRFSQTVHHILKSEKKENLTHCTTAV